jgi:hypothetical protein
LGQQQLLLIVLAIIIVGIAVALSITLFRQNAIDQKRDLLMNESINLANMAQAYYKKPKMLNGGGMSFEGWKFPPEMETTATGTYEAEINVDNVVITGVGNEVVTGNYYIEVRVTVLPNTFSTEIIH